MVIYVCSRYRSDNRVIFNEQLKMTKKIARELVELGHDVIVPHLYYTEFLDDNDEEQREQGIESALRLMEVCDVVFAYMGMGMSSGMEKELEYAKEKGIKTFFFRSIGEMGDVVTFESMKKAWEDAKKEVCRGREGSEILGNINKMMMCTSSKYLGEVIKAKNNILDIFDKLDIGQGNKK